VGKVTRLRPKRQDVILEGLQFALDFGDEWGLRPETKADIARAVGRLAPPEKWGYVMLNPEQQRHVLQAIDAGPKPHTTLKIWQAVISFIAYDRDGDVAASQAQIATAASVSAAHTSTALSRLVEIGVLIRTGRGRYQVNGHVAWSGPLHKREIAAKEHPPVKAPPPGPLLTLMDGGKP
jgi:hypothetical protein